MMNLQNFKLLKEDNSSYQIGHPNGKSITVSKSGLNEKAHKLIQKLRGAQGLSSGGTPSSGDVWQEPANLDTTDRTNEMLGSIATGAKNLWDKFNVPITPEAIAEEAAAKAPPAPVKLASTGEPPLMPTTIEQMPGVAAPTLPAAASPFENTGQALQNAKSAIEGGAAAQATEGASNAKTLHDMNAARDAEEEMRRLEFEQGQVRSEDLFQKYQDKKIDPNHFWHSKTTGSKILAGIGMALSGMGSATTGQSNLAMDSINRAISNDLEAQKNDQSKAMNLYKMNLEMTHNANEAHLLTENQMLIGAKAKAMEAAAIAQGPMAKAGIAPVILDINQKIQDNNFKQAIMKGGSQVQDIDPAQLVSRYVPKEHQKEVFGEIKQAQGAAQNGDFLLKNFDEAAQKKQLLKNPIVAVKSAFPGYDIAEIKAMDALSLPMIHDAEGRVNEFEQKTIQGLYPAVGDTDERLQKKRAALEAFINQKKSAPTAKGYGLDLEKFNSTSSSQIARLSPQQRQFYQWAKANPGDKRAAVVMQKLGITQ